MVVSPEFEECLREDLSLVPGSASAGLRHTRLLHLRDAAMQSARFANGTPFEYQVAGQRVHGCRTFLEVGERRDETRRPRSASAG